MQQDGWDISLALSGNGVNGTTESGETRTSLFHPSEYDSVTTHFVRMLKKGTIIGSQKYLSS
jgi:hypothetical protein